MPRADNTVIGEIVDIGLNGWRVNIGWAYEANLSVRDATSDFVERRTDLTQFLNYGDIIVAKVTYVMGSKLIDLSMRGPGLKKLFGGLIIQITPAKVPRVIGKEGSMISLLKEKTDCRITVGQNGRVWISGADPKKELIVVRAIRKIADESTSEGLTDHIKEFLEKELK